MKKKKLKTAEVEEVDEIFEEVPRDVMPAGGFGADVDLGGAATDLGRTRTKNRLFP